MIVIGITGGIGSGKTTVVNFFKDLGVPVYIADEEAKKLMNTSPTLKEAIVDNFGALAYHDNQLNREYLAKHVFKDPKALQQLSSLVHPAVAEDFKRWKKEQTQPLLAYEAAIIFENNKQNEFDYTILVTAPKELKIERIQKRDHSTLSQIEARMNSQWDDERKAKLADFVIINRDLIKTEQYVLKIYKYLKNTHKF